MTRFFVGHRAAAKSQLDRAQLIVVSGGSPGFADVGQRGRQPRSRPSNFKHLPSGVIRTAAAAAGALCLLAPPAFAQTDPGVRGGLNNTAGYLEYQGIPIPHPPVISPNPTTGATITANELALFNEGINRAGQLESTCDECADVPDGSPVVGLGELDPLFPQFHTNSNGLGARHNADQCFVCHAQPTLGGSGGFLVPNPGQGTPMLPENPLFRLVPLRFGKKNVVPVFEQQYGPVREVRFKYNPDGTRDGSVHQLWVVTGITTDPTLTNCALTQPNFAAQFAAGNLSFRIPLQLLGLGLIDSIQDREILSHFIATASQRAALGIAGHPNLSANDDTITRFGWKAQNKSITMFAAEAYNVEMGISNELFPTATEEDPGCQGPDKPEPNDVTRTETNDVGPPPNQSFDNPLHIMADWMMFQLMMRFTDAPQPAPNPSASAQRGQVVFNAIGCALCHTPQMQTAPVMNSAVLENRPANLFSDLLLHHMGAGLADNIIQGQAGPDEFRTTPLWGVGQRMFFLHDGRTSDLLQAIQQHFSPGSSATAATSAVTPSPAYPPSEANAVILNFRKLPATDQQAVLDFLRSL
jgi:Di-haem oxidoreductase, putative peroxidase